MKYLAPMLHSVAFLVKPTIAVASAALVYAIAWRIFRFPLPGSKDKANVRRLTAVHAYIGVNGSGKSLAMVHDTLGTFGMRWKCDEPTHRHTQEGITEGLRRIYSTVRITNPDGTDHPQYVRLWNSMQLVNEDVTHADVLFDEAVGSVASAEHAALPVQVRNFIVQCRRRDVVIRVSSIQYSEMHKTFRGACQAVTHCTGMLEKQIEGRLHPERSLFRWRTYDARDWQDVTEAKLNGTQSQKKAKPLASQLYYRPGKPAQDHYRTLEAVTMLVHVDQAGICGVCGGKRTVPGCVCDEYVERRQKSRKRAPEVVSEHPVEIPAEWLVP